MMAKDKNNWSIPHISHYDTHGAITSNNKNEVDSMTESSKVSSVSEIMMGHSSLSTSLRHKTMTFARYVSEYTPREWVSYFATYIRDTPTTWMDSYSGNGDCTENYALTQLWCDVSDIFDELHRSETNATQSTNT